MIGKPFYNNNNKNLDKISWYNLSKNPNAIHILEFLRRIGSSSV